MYVARLAGHCTSPEDLARTSWEEWVASGRRALHHLRDRCRAVAVAGLSMGGAIALHMAATEDPDAVVAMATPVRLRLLWLPSSRHVVTLDRDRHLLFGEIRRFLGEHLRAA